MLSRTFSEGFFVYTTVVFWSRTTTPLKRLAFLRIPGSSCFARASVRRTR